MEDELLLIRWCTSVLDPVGVHVESLVHHSWEPLLPLLASVESIPTMVHERVESVVEALSVFVAEVIILDVDRLS